MTTVTTQPNQFSINDLKEQKQQKVDQLITDCSMFFAFSNEQFHANKTPLAEGEKYVSLGHGAYIPKGKVDQYLNGMESISKWYKQATKGDKARKANIAYELANHEAYYTYDIEDTLDALGGDYTAAEVWAVFHAEKKNHEND